jgi:hypothetical protein
MDIGYVLLGLLVEWQPEQRLAVEPELRCSATSAPSLVPAVSSAPLPAVARGAAGAGGGFAGTTSTAGPAAAQTVHRAAPDSDRHAGAQAVGRAAASG